MNQNVIRWWLFACTLLLLTACSGGGGGNRGGGGDDGGGEGGGGETPDPIAAPEEITVVAGDGRVLASWTEVPDATGYVLYWSHTPGIHPDTSASYDDLLLDAASPQVVTGLSNNATYYFTVTSVDDDSSSMPSPEVYAIPRGRNDTGIVYCGNYLPGGAEANDNALDCAEVGATATEEGMDPIYPVPPGQDALFGRDAAAAAGELDKIGNGDAGFDFTRVCHSGEAAGEGSCPAEPALGDEPDNWGCTRDNVTGLLWEVKVDNDSHPRHMGHLYTWYNPDPTSNGGGEGTVGDSETCEDSLDGAACNTHSYVTFINASGGLCGTGGWRMPLVGELLSIVHFGRTSPALDPDHFPNTSLAAEDWMPSGAYWAANPAATQGTGFAQSVGSVTGVGSSGRSRQTPTPVRLVHSSD
jgi:hypothetical protein